MSARQRVVGKNQARVHRRCGRCGRRSGFIEAGGAPEPPTLPASRTSSGGIATSGCGSGAASKAHPERFEISVIEVATQALVLAADVSGRRR